MPAAVDEEAVVVDIFLEFLEAFFHQVLFLRELYSPALFDRHRLYGVAVRKARHPQLSEYVRDVVTHLKTPLLKNTLVKVVLVVKSPTGQPLERFVVEPTMLKRLPAPAHLDILDIEAQLRAALLKLQYSDALLPPRPPVGCTFEVVAYCAGRGSLAVDAWAQEQPPLADAGLELGEGAAELVPIKSCSVEGAFRLQTFYEGPHA